MLQNMIVEARNEASATVKSRRRTLPSWAYVLLVIAAAPPVTGWTQANESQLKAMRATKWIDSAAINDPKRAQDWLSTGRTYAEQRYSPLTQITVANASTLGLAWSLDLPSKGTL